MDIIISNKQNLLKRENVIVTHQRGRALKVLLSCYSSCLCNRVLVFVSQERQTLRTQINLQKMRVSVVTVYQYLVSNY